MPAKSKAQQRLMAACAHGRPMNRCPKHMSREQMREFASTPTRKLPEHVKKRNG
jgi:hypothetical protein